MYYERFTNQRLAINLQQPDFIPRDEEYSLDELRVVVEKRRSVHVKGICVKCNQIEKCTSIKYP